jgi:hypothetical protein
LKNWYRKYYENNKQSERKRYRDYYEANTEKEKDRVNKYRQKKIKLDD